MYNNEEERPEWVAKDRILSNDEIKLIYDLIGSAIDHHEGLTSFPTEKARWLQSLFIVDD